MKKMPNELICRDPWCPESDPARTGQKTADRFSGCFSRPRDVRAPLARPIVFPRYFGWVS